MKAADGDLKIWSGGAACATGSGCPCSCEQAPTQAAGFQALYQHIAQFPGPCVLTLVCTPHMLCAHSPSGGARPSSAAIFRTATSRYTTAEQSTLEDLKCQICLNTLRQCVALEPCGHNFCATCLSHHLGNSLQGGLQLSCPFRCGLVQARLASYVRAMAGIAPCLHACSTCHVCMRGLQQSTAQKASAPARLFVLCCGFSLCCCTMLCTCRCPPPERIIINYAVRALIDLLSSNSRSLSGALQSRAGSMGTAVAAAAVGSNGAAAPRSTRAGNSLTSAFGQAPGSYSNLTGLVATPSAAATPAGQQQHAQHAGSPPAGAAGQQGGSNSSSSIARVASATSASSLDGVAGAAAAAAAAGLPGVAEEPGSGAGDNNRSRFAAAAGVNGNGLVSAGMPGLGCAQHACSGMRPRQVLM